MGLKSIVECSSAYDALSEVVQTLLVLDQPYVDVVSGDPRGAQGTDPVLEFERCCKILRQSHLVREHDTVDEARGGRQRIRVLNPMDSAMHLPARIRLNSGSEAVAVALHVFLLLRVRYQASSDGQPMARVDGLASDSTSVDLLYLIGDAFTERYPTVGTLERRGDHLALTLVGERAPLTGGLPWRRDRYVRCRDASLLVHVLRDCLHGAAGPLVVPRSTPTASAIARVRVPTTLLSAIGTVRWLDSLRELEAQPVFEPVHETGDHGEHLAVRIQRCGYIAATGSGGGTTVVSVRVDETQTPNVPFISEDVDTVGLAFEALGGAREIGANCYVYSFGHRKLLVDVGFDAARDGWLGLPAFERLSDANVLVLTHAHLDHVGSLPVILTWFPELVVYCTEATRAVLIPQLNDSAKIGELRSKETGEPASFSRGMVGSIRFERFRVVSYGEAVDVPEIPGLRLEFRDAGHIIGSAGVLMTFVGSTIFHTGDISVEDQYLSHGMQVADAVADHVVMEGTYCGDPKFSRADRRAAVDHFLSSLAVQLDGGGSVLVPAFSLGRAQELVGLVVDWLDRTDRRTPVWTVGLVNILNAISAAHSEFLPGLKGKPFSRVREFERVDVDGKARGPAYAAAFGRVAAESPCVVIASHGMMAENTGSFLIGRAILTGEDRRHAIFLCGYMDPRTPGFRLRTQCESPTIEYGMGDLIARSIPSANIQFHRLTAHASYEELCEVAVRMPTRSLTLIHGDGAGLDQLKADIETRLVGSGKEVRVRAPGIRERFELARVPPPPNWDLPMPEASNQKPGPGRRRHKERGLSIGGLSSDGRWAVVGVGSSAATLSLDLDRVALTSIERVHIRSGSRRSTVYDRRQNVGDLRRIEWGTLGRATWVVDGVDPNGAEVRCELPLLYGAEFRPTRRSLDATLPVVEFEVGGNDIPQVMSLSDGTGNSLTLVDQQWHGADRLLRVRLGPISVSTIDDLRMRVRWAGGGEQDGPGLGTFTVGPIVDFGDSSALAGVPIVLPLRATPAPLAARVSKRAAALSATTIAFTARCPGRCSLELQYRTPGGVNAWVEVATVEVAPSAVLSLPVVAIAGQSTTIYVSDIDSRLHGKTVALRVGDRVADSWIASAGPRAWVGSFENADTLEVGVVLENGDLICGGGFEVRAGASVDFGASSLVTTADGDILAEIAWRIANDGDRTVIEEGFLSGGFEIARWEGTTLFARGTEATLGVRRMVLNTVPWTELEILTLPDVKLQLRARSPLHPGALGTLSLATGDLALGLQDVDDGPLTVEADRIVPLFDGLSTLIRGNTVRFNHAGQYSIFLRAGRRVLAELQVVVEGFPPFVVSGGVGDVDAREESYQDASAAIAELGPRAGTLVLAKPEGRFRVLQGSHSGDDEALTFIREQLAEHARVVVVWPGLAMGPAAGRLLSRLRAESSHWVLAHLPYPAPRGEVVADVEDARKLRRHRVLCCAPAGADIDRGDAYKCPQCASVPRLRTDDRRIWIRCAQCNFEDRDVVLTLNEFRGADASVLFADYRMARYLREGSGTRYAGAFGRFVRCSGCRKRQAAFSHPTRGNRAELQAAVAALRTRWDANDVARSLRLAARQVTRRALSSSEADARRLEEMLLRLLDAGVIVDGRSTALLSRVEASRSLCCDRPLEWAPRRVSHVFLSVEELLVPTIPPGAHPDLVFGEAGVRQLLMIGI